MNAPSNTVPIRSDHVVAEVIPAGGQCGERDRELANEAVALPFERQRGDAALRDELDAAETLFDAAREPEHRTRRSPR